ncbi:MAG: hypothetical protein WA738_04875 [Candidatus Angelobacter sp.]
MKKKPFVDRFFVIVHLLGYSLQPDRHGPRLGKIFERKSFSAPAGRRQGQGFGKNYRQLKKVYVRKRSLQPLAFPPRPLATPLELLRAVDPEIF